MDTSSRSAQPRESTVSVLCYNGEIYNCAELCSRMGHRETERSDTVVLQDYLDRFGVQALGDINGMFAFAYWDKRTAELSLVRDSLGIKPLYYCVEERRLVFASEVLPILSLARKRKPLDIELLRKQILFTSALTNQQATLIKGIRALPPGSCWTYSIQAGRLSKRAMRFSTPRRETCASSVHSAVATPNCARETFEDIVRRQRQAQVPVGVLASGGIDSSILFSLLRAQGPAVTAISCQYIDNSATLPSDDFSIASRLMEERGERIVPAECRLDSDSCWRLTDIVEPHSLSDDMRFLAIRNNYRVANECGLRVVLNGQGADELFGGYLDERTWGLIAGGSPADIYRHIINKRLPAIRLPAHEALVADFVEELLGSCGDQHALSAYLNLHRDRQLQRVLQFEDYYSMQFSVECRVPFLDARSVELAENLGAGDYFDATGSKPALRRVASEMLPEYIWARKKSPFPAIPSESAKRVLERLSAEIEVDAQSVSFLEEVFQISNVADAIRESGCMRTAWNAAVLVTFRRKYDPYVSY